MSGTRMKKLILIALLFCKPAWSAQLDYTQCVQFYQAWVFNGTLEEVCHLDKCVSFELEYVAKLGCQNILTAKLRNRLTEEVLRSFKSDLSRHGEKALCKAMTPGHEALKADKDVARLCRREAELKSSSGKRKKGGAWQ